MKIYLAGFGHQIEKTEFVKWLRKDWNCLLSYYYLNNKPPCKIDGGMKNRFNYICKQKEKALDENK